MLKKITAMILSLTFVLTLCSMTLASSEHLYMGMDVSVYQGNIDWSKVKESGIDYVILRVGTGKGKDANFEQNYLDAKEAGLDVGCYYYYTYASDVSEAETDARTVLSWIEGKQLEYPVYYDIESEKSQNAATDIYFAFADILQQNDWYVGLYCNENWLVNFFDRERIEASAEIWYARWTSDGKPEQNYGKYGMWQYTNTGSCEGIKGPVDLNVCYKDYPSIIKNGGFNGFDNGDYVPFAPDENSGFYILNGYIYGGNADMTVEEFLQKANFSREAVLDSTDTVKTGMSVSAADGEEKYVFILKGDVDCNGKITSTDFMQIRRHFLGTFDIYMQ